tara:strand:+ start:170 stop:1408 length:1239 start_codon:yes stop_codon:yes gene_type:complete
VKYIFLFLALAFLVLSAQPSEAVEVLHTYDSMKEDTQELASQYPDIAIYSEHGISTGLDLEIFSVDVALNITELTDEELNSLPTMYVDGTHHGNEGMSAEASFLFLQDVLQRSTADPSYLEGKRLVVTPSVNPDGYVLDCRSNWNGVDLNRNYPYMWGMYGTSDTPNFCPVSGTYKGSSEGSEIETQINMEFMRNMNLYVYFSAHTGSNDIVLPWKITGEFAVPIADWELYEYFLNESTNVSGLTYRDPGGAGESIAWGYGARAALSLIVEVDDMQWSPLVSTTIRGALSNELLMYDMAWENLELVGGHLQIIDESYDSVTVQNIGWGAAYNVTTGNEIIERVERNQVITLSKSYNFLQYNRLIHEGEEIDLTLITMNLTSMSNPNSGTTPSIDFISITLSLAIVSTLRRKK